MLSRSKISTNKICREREKAQLDPKHQIEELVAIFAFTRLSSHDVNDISTELTGGNHVQEQ